MTRIMPNFIWKWDSFVPLSSCCSGATCVCALHVDSDDPGQTHRSVPTMSFPTETGIIREIRPIRVIRVFLFLFYLRSSALRSPRKSAGYFSLSLQKCSTDRLSPIPPLTFPYTLCYILWAKKQKDRWTSIASRVNAGACCGSVLRLVPTTLALGIGDGAVGRSKRRIEPRINPNEREIFLFAFISVD